MRVKLGAFLFALIIALIGAGPVRAQTQTSSVEGSYFGALTYTALEFPIPNKFGARLGKRTSPGQSWEVEYVKGSWGPPGGFRKLGSLSDSRFSVIGRSFMGEHFHFIYGVSFFDFSADVGDALVSGVSGGAYPSMNAAKVQALGLNVGLGHSWVFRENVVLGIDWISWAQPLKLTRRSSDFIRASTDETTKAYVADTLKIISYIPRFSILSVHLGMLF